MGASIMGGPIPDLSQAWLRTGIGRGALLNEKNMKIP
jgi:hypothetical protein